MSAGSRQPRLPAIILSAIIVGDLAGCGSTTPALTVPIPHLSGQASGQEVPWWQTSPTPPSDNGPTSTTFSLSGDVLFEPDQSDLTPAAASQLTVILKVVQNHPGAQVLVACHADHGSGGTSALPLSNQRASTVGGWFAQGVPAERIQTQGYGDTKPLAPSDTPEHRAQNRRCDITVTSK